MLLSKLHKRLIVFLIASAVSAYIWHVNRDIFGNTIETSLILSITTVLCIYVPFEIYFSVRDLYYDRWEKIKLSRNFEISKLRIHIDPKKKKGFIVGNLVESIDKEKVDSTRTIIIINPGLSDKKEALEYLYLPLADYGYTIFAYDSRGIGESKKLGKRSQFIRKIDDYKEIINWIAEQERFKDYTIYSIGMSIGALIAVSGSLTDERVKKIVAISLISEYKKNIRRLNPLILFSFLLKGINFFPKEEDLKLLSPTLFFNKTKLNSTHKEWERYVNKLYLVHCKNDNIIKFRNFKKNKSILDLPDDHCLVFKKGGHALKKNEIGLTGAVLRFLNQSSK
ncbi:MAG: alpha/beta fold hydrolase [Candidatus Lokiarchaeota archaeon]|nr:alpha/beta fold hydrolase [Candidatus Lokiarchaeota archaeon]MBD3200116.1 alpha/beta fold hydrolase [Candidatus Lokiarchaeota archaeon]